MASSSEIVKTPEGRGTFIHIFEPRADAVTADGKPKYQMGLLLPPDADLSGLKKAAMDAVELEWPDPAKRPGKIKSPFLQASDHRLTTKGVELEGYDDGWTMIRLNTTNKPPVVDHRVVAITDSEKVYAGAWYICAIHAFAGSHPKSGAYVSFGLDAVQKVRDDKQLGGNRIDVESVFSPVGEAASAASSASADSIFG